MVCPVGNIIPLKVLCVYLYASYLCVNMCVGKEDGKTCKRVAIRTTIRKDDCRSNAPVREESMFTYLGGRLKMFKTLYKYYALLYMSSASFVYR